MSAAGQGPGRWTYRLCLLACVLSGAAGLTYELLWFRWLSIPFGSSARAAALVLSAYFLGSAVGARVVAPMGDRVRYPLLLFGLLEMAIGLVALLVPAARGAIGQAYAWGVEAFGLGSPWAAALTLSLAVAAMLPATAAMGATLPTLMRAVEDPARPGSRTVGVYSANLLGAFLGIGAAGFWAIPALGASKTLAGTMLLSGSVATLAAGLGARVVLPRTVIHPSALSGSGDLLALAAGSGALTIALEVLCTRLLAQVLQNCVYSFASMLLVAIGGLALGAALTATSLKTRLHPRHVLAGAMALAGLLVMASPSILFSVTRMEYLTAGCTASAYVTRVASLALITVFPICLLAGMALPLTLALLEARHGPKAAFLGRALAWNALAAAVAGIVTAEAVLPALGLTGAVGLVAAGYGLLSIGALGRVRRTSPAVTLAAFGTLVVAAGLVLAGNGLLRPMRPLPLGILYATHTPSGMLRVHESGGQRLMTLDGHYRLGGTRSATLERRQMHLPLLLHRAPRRVACIGLATGITAGAALDHPVERLTVYEIVPEVIEAAAFFSHENGAVLRDPRTRLVPEDGRLALEAEGEAYDIIVCDLVLPWQESAGALYSADFLRTARRRLAPDGAFWLWLPMYQLAEREYAIVARTFLSVFPDAQVFRGDDTPDRPIIALVGGGSRPPRTRVSPVPDDPLLDDPGEALSLYAGPLRVPAGWDPPLHTDDRPILPYLAADSVRRGDSFVGKPFSEYLRSLGG